MNELTNIRQTMSSREIAELTGKTHDNVLKAIRNMEGAWFKITGVKFNVSEYTDSTGRKLPMYELTKTESLYVATKFNDEARAKLIIRWQELETKVPKIDFSDPDTVLLLAQNWKDERQKRIAAESAAAKKDEIIEIQHETINDLAPKADYAEKVLTSKDTFTATQLAKEFGFAAKTLNQKLRELRVQYKHGGQWLLYAKYQSKGYTKTNTYTEDIGGETRTWHSTVWTEKGRLFIHDLLTKEQAVVDS